MEHNTTALSYNIKELAFYVGMTTCPPQDTAACELKIVSATVLQVHHFESKGSIFIQTLLNVNCIRPSSMQSFTKLYMYM